MEGTTAATPTNFIYAIVKQSNSEALKLISLPCQLNHTPTDSELRKFHNYATSLGCAYSSCLPHLTDREIMIDEAWRREAIAWKDTYEKLRQEYTTVAYSHRYGGWTGIDWQFNDDISFHISTNFGFGCSSYFYLIVRYKDVILTPYEDYIRYRNADVSQLIRYTESYGLVEPSWKTLMEEALAFYNAVVYQKDLYIFGWVLRHLENMTSGIEKLRTAKSYSFDNRQGGKDAAVTGDELTIVKANKIANSLDFIDNIRTLPAQVNPEQYATRLLAVCCYYLPELNSLLADLSEKERELKDTTEALKQDADYQLYMKLRSKYYHEREWYRSAEKRNMLRFLLTLLHRTMPTMQLDEVRQRITVLKLLNEDIKDKERTLSHISNTIRNLSACQSKITAFLAKEMAATA